MKEIICTDAVRWAGETECRGSIITSLPDDNELGVGIDEWEIWFRGALEAVLGLVEPKGVAIFYQTDRKAEGRLINKAGLILETGAASGFLVLWHKIVLRREVGTVDLFRPGYAHMLALSREAGSGKATPDVIPVGRTLYPNGMSLAATSLAVRFAGQRSGVMIDPFCGRGTIPAVAEALGYDAIGVDIDPEQARRAEGLRLARL